MAEQKRASKKKVSRPKVRPPKNSFAAVLVAARMKKGITRAEMARRYKAAPTVITRLESGRNQLSEATIRRYARALGMRPALNLLRGVR
jgi:transcriptional regulator with XRE-family HTH domain